MTEPRRPGRPHQERGPRASWGSQCIGPCLSQGCSPRPHGGTPQSLSAPAPPAASASGEAVLRWPPLSPNTPGRTRPRGPGLPFLALGLPSPQGDGRLRQSSSCPQHTLPAPSPDPLPVPLLPGAHLPASPLRARLEPLVQCQHWEQGVTTPSPLPRPGCVLSAGFTVSAGTGRSRSPEGCVGSRVHPQHGA